MGGVLLLVNMVDRSCPFLSSYPYSSWLNMTVRSDYIKCSQQSMGVSYTELFLSEIERDVILTAVAVELSWLVFQKV
jgi:hypothetical protein